MTTEMQSRLNRAETIAKRLTYVSYDAITGLITLSNQGCPVYVGALAGGMVGTWGDYGTSLFSKYSSRSHLSSFAWATSLGLGYAQEKYRIAMGCESEEFHMDTAAGELREFIKEQRQEELECPSKNHVEVLKRIEEIEALCEGFGDEATQREFVNALSAYDDPECFYNMGEVTRQKVLNARVIMRRAWELLLEHEPTIQPPESVLKWGWTHDDGSNHGDTWHAQDTPDNAIEELLEHVEISEWVSQEIGDTFDARIYACDMERFCKLSIKTQWDNHIYDMEGDRFETTWETKDIKVNAHTKARLEQYLEELSKSVHTNLFHHTSRYMKITVERVSEDEFKVHTPPEFAEWERWEKGRAQRHVFG